MFWVLHALVGMILGLSLDNIPLIIILGISSHFLMDMLPHWDGYFNKDEFVKRHLIAIDNKTFFIRLSDGIITIMMIAFFVYVTDSYYLLLGALVTLLPDMAKIGVFMGLEKNKTFMRYLEWHSRIQRDVGIVLGLVIQFVLAGVLFFFLWGML